MGGQTPNLVCLFATQAKVGLCSALVQAHLIFCYEIQYHSPNFLLYKVQYICIHFETVKINIIM